MILQLVNYSTKDFDATKCLTLKKSTTLIAFPLRPDVADACSQRRQFHSGEYYTDFMGGTAESEYSIGRPLYLLGARSRRHRQVAVLLAQRIGHSDSVLGQGAGVRRNIERSRGASVRAALGAHAEFSGAVKKDCGKASCVKSIRMTLQRWRDCRCW